MRPGAVRHTRAEYPADRDDERDEESRSRWARVGTACAAIFGAILLSSVGIIVWDRVSGDNAHTANAPAGPPGAVRVPATGTVPRPAGSATAAVTDSPTPSEVTWLQVGLGALPFSGTAGPTTIRAGVPSGFAHTRAGAVQAAIQILGRLSWSAQTRSTMQAVVSASTTPAARAGVVVSYGPPTDPSLIPQVAGFQPIAYSATQAVINLALRFNGVLRICPATVQWVGSTTTTTTTAAGGDWKLAGAPGPLSQTSWAAVEDLTGYVLFSGQPTKAGD